MKKQIRQISVVMLLGIMILGPMVVQAQSITTPPPSDLTAKWWQWAVGFPATSSPITDQTGASCGDGQSGPVWFLAGTAGGSVTRTCTIPFGKAILFPIITAEWSVSEANANGGNCFVPGVTPNGTSKAALTACANSQVNHVTFKEAQIDGVDIQNLDNYRVQSPLFSFNAVADNPFGIPPGPSKSVSDGFWVLSSPLPKGQHTIHFRGTADFPELGFTFDTEATYNVLIS